MALFFTVLLVISIVGLVGLIALKRFELSTGRVALRSVRPGVGRWLGRGLLFLERRVPALVRIGGKAAYSLLRRSVHRLVAWVLLQAEHALERVLHVLRHTTQTPRGEGEASEFLREVAEHKRSLLKKSARSKKQHAIYEE